MFKSLRIKHYQSHRDTFLDFSPFVNVIVGTSLHGKTAILRAINLLINNRPLGAKFYSHFAPDEGMTEIEAVLSNPSGDIALKIEKQVTRDKKKVKKLNKTTYNLISPQGKEDWSGIDKQVPDRVINTLNMGELNIQKQFDQPFLIMSTGGEFARTINRVTKLEQVDEWVSSLTKKLNTETSKVKILEGQAKQIELELSKYVGFEDLGESVDTIKKLDAEVRGLQTQYFTLDGLLVKAEKIEKQLQSMPSITDIQQDVDLMQKLQDEINLNIRQSDMIKRAVKLNTLIGGLEELVEGLHLIISAKEEQYLIDQFDGKLLQIEKINSTIDKYQKEYDVIVNEYIRRLKKQKKCPICLSDIGNEIIKRLKEQL